MQRIHYDKKFLKSVSHNLRVLYSQTVFANNFTDDSFSIHPGVQTLQYISCPLLLSLSITFDAFPDVSFSPPSTMRCGSLPGSLQPQGGMSSATLFVGMSLAQGSQHSGRAGTVATAGKRKKISCIFSSILGSDEYSQPKRHKAYLQHVGNLYILSSF